MAPRRLQIRPHWSRCGWRENCGSGEATTRSCATPPSVIGVQGRRLAHLRDVKNCQRVLRRMRRPTWLAEWVSAQT